MPTARPRVKLEVMDKPLTKLVALFTPKRRWAQFSLATMFVVVTVLAFGFAWLAVQINQANRQRNAVAQLRESGVSVWYKYGLDESGMVLPDSTPCGPEWLTRIFGDDVFFNARAVAFRPASSDSDLIPLQQLVGLVYIDFLNARVTDAGMAQLQQLHDLEGVDISGTRVTNAGLEHLSKLSKLKWVVVENSSITDAGVFKLQKALPNCRIIRRVERAQ